MEIERDRAGRVVAVLTIDDATDAVSWRVGDATAIRAISALVEQICTEAAESGQACPDAVLVEFGHYFRSRWV